MQIKINFRSSTTSTYETRDNIYKLPPDLMKYYFTNKIVPIWNSLPNSVLSADSTSLFKSRLDRFWKSHAFVYNYKAH